MVVGRRKDKVARTVAGLPGSLMPDHSALQGVLFQRLIQLWGNHLDCTAKAQQRTDAPGRNLPRAKHLHPLARQGDKQREIGEIRLWLLLRADSPAVAQLRFEPLQGEALLALLRAADQQDGNPRLLRGADLLVHPAGPAGFLGHQAGDIPLADHRQVQLLRKRSLHRNQVGGGHP